MQARPGKARHGAAGQCRLGVARLGEAGRGKAGNYFWRYDMSNKRVKQVVYQFRQGARYSVGADVVGKEFERLQSAHGSIQPGTVVDESRPESAPLHPVFEWDDFAAGEAYRKMQARALIRSVLVVHPKDEPPTRAYVNVSSSCEEHESGYQPVSVVAQRPDLYALAMANLSMKFESARAAMEELKAAAAAAPDTDHDRMARINIAVQAMQTASAAVQALH